MIDVEGLLHSAFNASQVLELNQSADSEPIDPSE